MRLRAEPPDEKPPKNTEIPTYTQPIAHEYSYGQAKLQPERALYFNVFMKTCIAV